MIQTTFANGINPFPYYTPPPPKVAKVQAYRTAKRETGKRFAPLLAYLRANEWVYLREITASIGLPSRTATNALSRLDVHGWLEKRGVPGHRQYRLVDAHRTPPAIEWTPPQ